MLDFSRVCFLYYDKALKKNDRQISVAIRNICNWDCAVINLLKSVERSIGLRCITGNTSYKKMALITYQHGFV
jgi:hypothetical protein